jgi:hypothetical protein
VKFGTVQLQKTHQTYSKRAVISACLSAQARSMLDQTHRSNNCITYWLPTLR